MFFLLCVGNFDYFVGDIFCLGICVFNVLVFCGKCVSDSCIVGNYFKFFGRC